MARASSAGENAATNGLTAVCTYTAIFTADPGAPATTWPSGEVSGGSYARQATAYGAAASGTATNSGALSIPIPAQSGTTYCSYFAEANSLAGTGSGVYEIGGALSSTIQFVTAGTLSIAVGALSIGSS
jgi:hypothetical protein